MVRVGIALAMPLKSMNILALGSIRICDYASLDFHTQGNKISVIAGWRCIASEDLQQPRRKEITAKQFRGFTSR